VRSLHTTVLGFKVFITIAEESCVWERILTFLLGAYVLVRKALRRGFTSAQHLLTKVVLAKTKITFSVFKTMTAMKSQNHRMVGVGRDLWGSPSPTPC